MTFEARLDQRQPGSSKAAAPKGTTGPLLTTAPVTDAGAPAEGVLIRPDSGVSGHASNVADPTAVEFAAPLPVQGAAQSDFALAQPQQITTASYNDAGVMNPVEAFNVSVNALADLLPQMGDAAGPLKDHVTTLVQLTKAHNPDDPKLRQAIFEEVVALNPVITQLLDDWNSGKRPQPEATVMGQFSTAMMMLAAVPATLNQYERLSSRELLTKGTKAEKVADVAEGLKGSVAARFHAGNLTGDAATYFALYAHVTVKDGAILDESGKALSDDEIDTRGTQVLDKALTSLDTATADIKKAADLYLPTCSDDERAAFLLIKGRLDARKQGQAAATTADAIIDSFLTLDEVQQAMGPFGDVTPDFVGDLMDGKVAADSMSAGQSKYVQSLGSRATIENNHVKVDVPVADRKKLKDAVAFMQHPKSPGATKLRDALVSYHKAIRRVEEVAAIFHVPVAELIGLRMDQVLGHHHRHHGATGKIGKTKPKATSHATVTFADIAAKRKDPGQTATAQAAPTMTDAEQHQESQFAEIQLQLPDDEAKETKRNVQQRDTAVRAGDAAARQAYQTMLEQDALERRNDRRIEKP